MTSLDQSPDLPFVFGAGLGRTGTHSLRAALMRLGHEKVFHMTELLEGRVPPDAWFQLAAHERETASKNHTMALETAQTLLDQGYTATTDYPACLLVPELIELRPDAKVILSIRSRPADWKDSVLSTIGIITIPMFKAPFRYSSFWRGFSESLTPWLWERTGGIATLGQMRVPEESLLDYGDRMEEAYETWVQTVQAEIPAEKLLVHHPRDGYAPICQFLGVTNCPQEAYPHLGDTAELQQLIRVFETVVVVFWPIVSMLVVLGVIMGWRRCGRGSSTKPKDE